MKWFIGALVLINILLYSWVSMGRPDWAELYQLAEEKVYGEQLVVEPVVEEPAPEPIAEVLEIEAESDEIVEVPMDLDTATLNEQDEMTEAVQEYWKSMFREKRDFSSPAERVALLREMRYLFRLGEEDSKFYWDVLQSMPEEYAEDKKLIGEIIIQNIALDSATEAMAMLVETDAVLASETYEDVVRIWMEEEGVSIMDWYDSVEELDNNPAFSNAFMKVYSEEDPLSFISEYGNHFRGQMLVGDAVDELYWAMGYDDASEALFAANLDPDLLTTAVAGLLVAYSTHKPDRIVQFIEDRVIDMNAEDKSKFLASPQVEAILMAAGSDLVSEAGTPELNEELGTTKADLEFVSDVVEKPAE